MTISENPTDTERTLLYAALTDPRGYLPEPVDPATADRMTAHHWAREETPAGFDFTRRDAEQARNNGYQARAIPLTITRYGCQALLNTDDYAALHHAAYGNMLFAEGPRPALETHHKHLLHYRLIEFRDSHHSDNATAYVTDLGHRLVHGPYTRLPPKPTRHQIKALLAAVTNDGHLPDTTATRTRDALHTLGWTDGGTLTWQGRDALLYGDRREALECAVPASGQLRGISWAARLSLQRDGLITHHDKDGRPVTLTRYHDSALAAATLITPLGRKAVGMPLEVPQLPEHLRMQARPLLTRNNYCRHVSVLSSPYTDGTISVLDGGFIHSRVIRVPVHALTAAPPPLPAA